ncbi:hypothetical protein ACIPVB_04160 [Microbacterium sp. NPDC090007]|uniref:hypothetical protein n=1 Tax=Microbacterium sp. NPDC090007 TaxID=3364204 RepID=UPI0038095555
MASPAPASRLLSRGDTVGMFFFLVLGVGLAVWAVVQSVLTIVAALPNRDVRVAAPFLDTVAQAPIGPDGAPVDVELGSGVVIAPELPIASLWALVIAQVLFAAVVVTVVALLLVLVVGILRGRIFSRRNTGLVSAAGGVTLVGVAGVPFFQNMVANGALAWISERSYERGLVQTVDLPVLFGVAFLAALAGTVFSVGDRLQRDTEGLV